MRPDSPGSRANSAVPRQLLRFGSIGAACTILQYLLLVLAVERVGADAAMASGAGFTASALLNYALNRRFTFGGHVTHSMAMSRFAVVATSGLLLTFLGMRLLHGWLRWHYLYAQGLVTLLVLLWNFAWHRHWTFAATARRSPGN